jgi:hypothetical protein
MPDSQSMRVPKMSKLRALMEVQSIEDALMESGESVKWLWTLD